MTVGAVFTLQIRFRVVDAFVSAKVVILFFFLSKMICIFPLKSELDPAVK
jgi:hypothetical protein